MAFTIERVWDDISRKYVLKYKRGNDYIYPNSLNIQGEHACCGSRSLNNMNVLTACPEFGTKDGLKQLIREMNRTFAGGNVTFILNSSQRGAFIREGILKNMDSIGQGLTETPFHNFNMRNTNYLYNWTFKGRKTKAKETT